MNNISSLIAVLTDEEKRKFISFLKQKNKRKDAKNIALFQLLNNKDIPTKIDEYLYGKPAKGAYHALSKRLYDSLIDFIAAKNFDGVSSEEMNTLKLLLAGRVLFEHNQVKLGYRTLEKAEGMARKYSLYTVLNEVLYTKIHNAHLNTDIDLNNLIEKYQQNKSNMLQEEQLNLFYATIQQELITNPYDIADIINRNLMKFNISITKNLSYQALLKILEISNEVAKITSDYYGVLQFIQNAYRQIETSERIETKHLYYHIQILYYMSNAFFRLRKFRLSESYNTSMYYYMGLQHKKFYADFYPQYTLIKNLLLIYSGEADKAIKNLSNFKYKNYRSQTDFLLDLKLALVVALFFKQQFKEAFKVFKEFYRSDTWYTQKAGKIWVIKKNLIEILLLTELDYLDLVESRLISFRKKHSTHLKKHSEHRVLSFVGLVNAWYNDKAITQSGVYKEQVNQLLMRSSREEDIFVISFYSWLQAKIQGNDMYSTCLRYLK